MSFPWTEEDVAAYNERIIAQRLLKARGGPRGPEPERPVCDEPLGPPPGEKKNSSRSVIRITSFRQRLIDPDNPCPKYFIDSLRYAGLIPDDTPDCVVIQVEQKKVKRKTSQRTEIEITKESP